MDTHFLRIIGLHALDSGLQASWTDYRRWGKGPKQRLKFSKFGDENIEKAYATHYVRKKKRHGVEADPAAPWQNATHGDPPEGTDP
ncbi:MAG: hypothetical protein GY851_14200 [bacterium]|nr:hypothetical protein [bacterium]